MTKNKEKAWLTFLTSNNYYIFLLLGLYKSLLDTKTKYPFYCGVTKEVNSRTRKILTTAGIKLIDLDTSVIENSAIVKSAANKKLCDWYRNALTKLALLDTNIEKQLDKVVYLDTDIYVFSNIDDLMDKPHMSAVQDLAPYHKVHEYTYGCSMFCSGMFVWDFKANPGLGHKLLLTLDELDLSIGWHDQNILNYWYKDWNICTELHLDYTYCMMNAQECIHIAAEEQHIPKAMHYVDRIRADWPFVNRKIIPARMKEFKTWVEKLSDAILFFNKKYQLQLPRILAYNLILNTPDGKAIKQADDRTNAYLYF